MVAVNVIYSFVDGAHFFTSDDPKWAGLCAASTDLKAAWEDVAIQLNHLAKGNHGIENADYEPASSFQEFLKELGEAMQAELAKVASPPTELAQLPGAMVPPAVAAWKMGQITL